MRPEILAPAGDDDAFEAALRAGADAVYLGLRGHNARARATNFDAATLPSLVARAHRRGTKVYVALNTLVFDHELDDARAAVVACAEAGVDALIVQDLGLVTLARAVAPTLPVHASTQMTCTDASSVAFAAALGIERVVLARELSVDDIAQVRAQSAVELEVFVHGAQCVSYSGQCLTSEAIGGRSANRGACAQACRLPYELVVDGVARPTGEQAYLLSLLDLEGSQEVAALAASGVSSLKIEGRLKDAEYVAASVRLYQGALDALDGATVDLPALREEAALTYSRGSGPGFLAGADHQATVEGRTVEHRGVALGTVLGVVGHGRRARLAVETQSSLARGDGVMIEGGREARGERGGRVWGLSTAGRDVEAAPAHTRIEFDLGPDVRLDDVRPGTRVWKSGSPHVEKRLRERLERAPHRRPLALRVTGRAGAHLVVEATCADGRQARVESDMPLCASDEVSRLAAIVVEKFGRLGDTPFVLGPVEVALDGDLSMPVSELNRMRRTLIAALEADVLHPHPIVGDVPTAAPEPRPATRPIPPGLVVLCRDLEQARVAREAGADAVVLDFLELVGVGRAVEALRREGPGLVGVATPRVRKPGEDRIDRYLRGLAPDLVLVRSLGSLHELRSGSSEPTLWVGDFSLNVANARTAAVVLDAGLDVFTPSYDLDERELAHFLAGPLAARAELVVHHPMPLFHTEHCVYAATLSDGRDFRTCGRPCERHDLALRDRAGMTHPVVADVGCRNTVFHERAQSGAGFVARARAASVTRFRIELVRERADEVRAIVAAYRGLLRGERRAEDVVRGLRTEAGLGVVRGSLRVLA